MTPHSQRPTSWHTVIMRLNALSAAGDRSTDIAQSRSYHIEHLNGAVTARYRWMRFGSLFQPIIDVATGAATGHEALLGAHSSAGPITALDVFAGAHDERDCVVLDRLCRAVHSLNFVAQHGSGLLFVNVWPGAPRKASSGHAAIFEELLDVCGLSRHRVVVEIPRPGSGNEDDLFETVRSYRARGFQVAVTGLGGGDVSGARRHRIWPDFYKVDMQHLMSARHDPDIVRAECLTVERLRHAPDIRVIASGVETKELAGLAVEMGADLAQGFYLGRPDPLLRSITQLPSLAPRHRAPTTWAARGPGEGTRSLAAPMDRDRAMTSVRVPEAQGTQQL